jgi:hypothetical protein
VKRTEVTNTETIIEVPEDEMLRFLGLASDEHCFVIMGSGPFMCYISKNK